MAKKKQTRIRVQSKSTGLTFDGHVDSIEELAKHFQDKWQTKQVTDLQHSLTGASIINSTDFKVYKKTFKGNLYRITFGGLCPLDIAGNLSDGGRFNIGGAQGAIASKYFKISKGASIYTAPSLACAKAETQFHENGDHYLLTPKRPLILVDLEKTIQNFPNYKGLKADVDSAPLSAVWSLQSVPMISQILATYIRDNFDYDGIIYPSTKYQRGKNISVFIPKGKKGSDFFKKKKV